MAAALTAPACRDTARDAARTPVLSPTAVEGAAEPITAIAPVAVRDPASAEIGRLLFHDRSLSQDRSVACADCHNLGKGGSDGRPRSVGALGAIGGINAPTVFNAALNFRQFWDGRAETLEDQAGGPLTNPLEMAMTWPEVLDRLRRSPDYVQRFGASFADGITEANVRSAIAAFERTLLTPNSRFDRHLRGDKGALSDAERRGYQTFKDFGCVSCHQGVNVGGNLYQKFGVMGDYFGDRGNPTVADLGRFNVTGDSADKNVFKVPSLRNIARTAPYFHDGSAATLDQAVAVMARYQLGRIVSAEEIAAIVAFLHTLTGEYQGNAL